MRILRFLVESKRHIKLFDLFDARFWVGNVYRFWALLPSKVMTSRQLRRGCLVIKKVLHQRRVHHPVQLHMQMPLDEHGVKRHEHADESDQTKRARRTCTKDTTTDDETNKQKLNQVTSTDLSFRA